MTRRPGERFINLAPSNGLTPGGNASAPAAKPFATGRAILEGATAGSQQT